MSNSAPVKPDSDWELVRALMEKHGDTNPVDWPDKDNAAYWRALKRLKNAGDPEGKADE